MPTPRPLHYPTEAARLRARRAQVAAAVADVRRLLDLYRSYPDLGSLDVDALLLRDAILERLEFLARAVASLGAKVEARPNVEELEAALAGLPPVPTAADLEFVDRRRDDVRRAQARMIARGLARGLTTAEVAEAIDRSAEALARTLLAAQEPSARVVAFAAMTREEATRALWSLAAARN